MEVRHINRSSSATHQPTVDRPTKSKLSPACLKGANVILPVGVDCQCDRQSCCRSTTRLSRVIYSASESSVLIRSQAFCKPEDARVRTVSHRVRKSQGNVHQNTRRRTVRLRANAAPHVNWSRQKGGSSKARLAGVVFLYACIRSGAIARDTHVLYGSSPP